MAKRAMTPDWPTTVRAVIGDGRIMGTDGSLWLYRSVPMNPVVDAVDGASAYQAAEPILAAIEEIAGMTVARISRRSAARSSYRRIHMLMVNVPRLFQPKQDSPIADYLSDGYGDCVTDYRILLFGVRLVDKVGGDEGIRSTIDSVVETLVSGMTPLSDFDSDYYSVDAAMARAGLHNPTSEDIRLAMAWWNHGRKPDTPILVHADHIHFFTDAAAASVAAKLDVDKCRDWPPITGHHATTFAAVQDFDLPYVPATSPAALWVPPLLAYHANAVSIRGLVEPTHITRYELRRQRKRNIEDINEFAAAGKMERAEQTERLSQLSEVEDAYATGGTATVVDASVLVAIDGQVKDIDAIGRRSNVVLNTMDFRQQPAMFETMMCSPVSANPHLHDLPAQAIACSGLPSLSTVGDRGGILLGFTEHDRQPAYLSPTEASESDSLPLFLCVGQTGSGKTMVLLLAADQFARSGTPVVIVDPKTGSHHDSAVLASGGQVLSLDSLAGADGAFDPLRFAISAEAGIDMASSMLLNVNPWGTMRTDYEAPLTAAIAYGVRHEAACIGEALRIAQRDGRADPTMVESAFRLAESSPMFRACFGIEPESAPLRLAKGITLIKVGQAHLDLPEPGMNLDEVSLNQRIALSLVRMMVFGSAMAMTGRGGVVMLDEAWVFLGAGRAEVERLGRLARSQNVLPMLFTQRVTDALEAGLAGYISRGFILPITDVDEAEAACELFKLEPTDLRMGRITARATMGADAENSGAPNWFSMRALRDPDTDKIIRGSIAIYADRFGRAVPVQVRIPDSFLEMASTNPEDIRRRLESQQLALEASKAKFLT